MARNHCPGRRVLVSAETVPGGPHFTILPPTASAISEAVHRAREEALELSEATLKVGLVEAETLEWDLGIGIRIGFGAALMSFVHSPFNSEAPSRQTQTLAPMSRFGQSPGKRELTNLGSYDFTDFRAILLFLKFLYFILFLARAKPYHAGFVLSQPTNQTG